MKRIGVLTSGGDSPGMNAAIRSVVRTGLNAGAQIFGVREGLRGLVSDQIEPLDWKSVGGILQKGGTILGTARCKEFLTEEGRKKSALHLLLKGIDRLVVIGGDGSLTGALILHQEWSQHLESLVKSGDVPEELAREHPVLTVTGLPGSIDNDQVGTDTTIGADTALHRIVDAVDCIFSTAASHQRTFVIEVMGRNCGYLALAAALATGAEWVLLPETPCTEDWRDRMAEALSKGRAVGRRASIVIVSEGARDHQGEPVTSAQVRQILEDKLGEDARVTILGHVQRGGSPTAFDRILATALGKKATEAALETEGRCLFTGMVGNRPQLTDLTEAIERTHRVTKTIGPGSETTVMKLRGGSFYSLHSVMETLVKAHPKASPDGTSRKIALVHGGSPAPGMNMAVRATVRLLLEGGHEVYGVEGGFRGLREGKLRKMDWMSVSGWSNVGGAALGTDREALQGSDFYKLAKSLEDHDISGLMMIGGWKGYEAVYQMTQAQNDFPAFQIPMVCLPASIDNNLPGSEFSIGADTALNSILEAVDKIKQSAVAGRRVFIVQVMGHHCGYLALLSGLATGAERVYLNEFGITASKLMSDVERLVEHFDNGKHLGLVIRNEKANPFYTTEFISALFEEEGRGRFDVRTSILGHLQQGGSPSPFDRLQAVRMAAECVDYLHSGEEEAVFLGLEKGQFTMHSMDRFRKMSDGDFHRAKHQWWLDSYGSLAVEMSHESCS